MSSIPSITALIGTPKLDLELRKQLHVQGKSPSFSYSSKSQIDATTEKRKFLDVQEALSIIKEGTKVEPSNYVPLLQDCLDKRSESSAQMVHAHIVKTGTHKDVFVMTSLVNTYAKYGRLEDAQKLFDQLPERNVFTWTALITGYVHHSQPQQAVRIFRQMLDLGDYPSNYTFGIVLNACSSLSLLELGRQIHAYAVKYGVENDASVGNSLCTLYTRCRILESAVNVFHRIQEKNVISWTTVISACADFGETTMGFRYFIQMLSENVEVNEFTFTSILSLCCVNQALGLGTQIHSMSIKLGYQWNLPTKNSVMYLYLKSGLFDEAQKLLNRVNNVSRLTWNAIIAGRAHAMGLSRDDIVAYHSGNEALHIFTKMNQSNGKPDLYTFSSIFSICSRLVALEQGEQVHAQSLKSGHLTDIIVATALVNMYSKCGSIKGAAKAFLEMPTRTVVSWTTMITAFAQNGQSKQALDLFEDMRLVGEKPNKITFVAVLSACSQKGLVQEAFQYFELMKNQYKFKPVTEHYTCLVDMYVRLGRLEEAFDLVKKINVGKQSEFMWSILIAGCRSQGKLELGFSAAEELLKLKLRDPSTYITLLNMYENAGRYQDAERIRNRMREDNVGDLQDSSWITIKEKVHSFTADEYHGSNTPDLEVKSYLEYLIRETGRIMTAAGATSPPPTAHLLHSEKLAVAFGLLHVPKAAVIRVVKSTTMCEDCHHFICLVSRMTNRKIIIRDKNRLHIFVDGVCSCGYAHNVL